MRKKKIKVIFSEKSFLEGSQTGRVNSSLGGQPMRLFWDFQEGKPQDKAQLNKRKPRVSSAKTLS